MKKTYLSIFVLFLISCFSPSCIEEYKIPTTLSVPHEAELVIQGRILAGEESVIYISKTMPLGEIKPEAPITHAKVTVIGQNGYKSSSGKFDELQVAYLIETKELSNNTQYAVKVELDGEIYQSEFQPIYDTPEIEEITYKEREDGISIHVSTSNTDDGARGYMWSYEEDWEFHADINMNALSNGILLYNDAFYQLNAHNNPYYYCWKHQNSRNIFIYSTENLNENKVKEHELFRIPIDDSRISYIYCVSIKQWCLSSEAYNYFRTVELHTEDTGGLFSPMPVEISGNVICTSNPEIKAHGYVIASNVKTKRLFIYASDFQNIIPEYSNCVYRYGWEDEKMSPNWMKSWWEDLDKYGDVIFTPQGNIDLQSIKYRKECVDCRETAGATKKRPDFWPNNHE